VGENPHYRQEMLTSIKTGITRLDRCVRAFFLQPGDMPFVRAQTYGKLLSGFDPDRMDMLRPHHKGRAGHPVLISTLKTGSIGAYPGAGGLRALVKTEQWRITDLDCSDPGIRIDLDHPEDIENAAAILTRL